MRKLLITITLALAVAFSALAQTAAPPDLSGTWILNSAKSKLVTGNHIGSETLVIAYSGAVIQFHYHAVPGGKDWTMAYTVDGKEHVTKQVPADYKDLPNPSCWTDVRPQQIYTKVNWKKSELTVETHVRPPYPSSSSFGFCAGQYESTLSADRWRLSLDGRVLTRTSEAVRALNAEYPKQTFVYDRQ